MQKTSQRLYESALYFLALCASDIGEQIRAENPDLLGSAQRIATEYETQYAEQRIASSDKAKELINSMAEAKLLLPLLPPSDIHDITELNDLLAHNAKELQDILLFNAELFYDKYLFSLISPSTTHLSEEVLKNERFALWFSGSKVVDTNRKPLVVYHGTGGLEREFDEFKFSAFPAVYFAENKSYSQWFASERSGGKSLVHQCYLRVISPLDLTIFGTDKITYNDLLLYFGAVYGLTIPRSKMMQALSDKVGETWVWRWFRMGVDMLNYIKASGEFDAILFYENNPDDKVNGEENVTKAWVVFHPNQIKSADIRNTTYSLESGKITMEAGGVA